MSHQGNFIVRKDFNDLIRFVKWEEWNKIMSEALEIPLKDLKEWLEEETVSIVEPLKAEGRSLFDNVRDKLDDILQSCDKLLEDAEKELMKGSRKTYRRAKIMNKLAKNISEMIDKVIIPDEISRESLDTLREDLERVLGVVGRERWKWFPVISPYFIMDRRKFDIVLKRAMDSLGELRSFSSDKYAKAETVEDAFTMVDTIRQYLSELDEVEKRKKTTESRRGVLEKKIAENQQEIRSIQSKSEVVELVQINEKTEELEEKVKHSLRYLQKPFLKFQSLARGPSYSLPLDEKRKLDEYLSNPFEALATEMEGYPILKSILKKMEGAMAQGKLKLKSSRLRKAKGQINSVLNEDALIPLHRSCKEAFSQRQRLSTSGAIATSQSELKKLQKKLKDLRKRKELVHSRGVVLDKKIKRTLEKIENQKKELEKIVLELTNRNVQVTL